VNLQRLADFERSASFPMRKRTGNGEKQIDARPLVDRIALLGGDTIEIDLRFTAAGSVKPTDLLAAIFELDPATVRPLPLHKTHAFYRSESTPTDVGDETGPVPAAQCPPGPTA
jgi:hypothetical protein